MKKFYYALFILFAFVLDTKGQTVNTGEYFFDVDPGLGHGKIITFNPDSVVSLDSIPITVNGLSLGYHWIYLRVKDSNNQWSFYLKQRFYVYDNSPILPVIDTLPELVQAEYWIDSIPTSWHGSIINLTPNDSIAYLDSIPGLALDTGNHWVSLRVKDSNGSWSFVKTNQFHICDIAEPFASFTYSVSDHDLHLNNTSTSQDSCFWSFGDGDTSNAVNPVHHYDTAGVFNVQLISVNTCTADTITKSIVVMGINSISPNYGGNIGMVTSTILGGGFYPGSTVKLVMAGTDSISVPDSLISIPGLNEIIATFDLTNKAKGFYDLVIYIPAEDTTLRLANAFEVVEGIEGTVTIFKSGTSAVIGRQMDYFISVQNTGNVNKSYEIIELLEPWFTYISAEPNAQIYSYQQNYFTEYSIDSIPSILRWKVFFTAGETKLITYKVKLLSSFPLGYTVKGCSCADQFLPYLAQCLAQLGNCMRSNSAYCNAACIQFPPTYEDCMAICEGSVAGYCLSNYYPCLDEIPDCHCDPDTARKPVDPNEKLVLAEKYIHSDQLLTYVIHYENIGSANAQNVFIHDVLDSSLDLATLRVISSEGNSFDTASRTMSWDLNHANLKPDSSGYVIYTVKPKPNLPSGTVIRNTGSIQFDSFSSNSTNETINIIDNSLPEGTMDSLPPVTHQPAFSISWSGKDSVGAIKSYSIYVAMDSGAYFPYLLDTTSTSAIFTGENGKTYHFICIAKDSAGNMEVFKPIAEATTLIKSIVTSTHNIDSTISINIFPNPTAGTVNIIINNHLDQNRDCNLIVKDLLGGIVYSTKVRLTNKSSSYQLDITSLPNGVYFFEISDNQFRLFAKIVKSL